MPGWDSLQTVTAAHGTFQLVGLILLVIAAGKLISVELVSLIR